VADARNGPELHPATVELARGRVVKTVTGQRARDHIDELSRKYHGQDYDPDDIKSERVIRERVGSAGARLDQGRTAPRSQLRR
jgi:hypothetical protein